MRLEFGSSSTFQSKGFLFAGLSDTFQSKGFLFAGLSGTFQSKGFLFVGLSGTYHVPTLHSKLLKRRVIDYAIVFNILDSFFYISLYKILCDMGEVKRIMTAYLKSLRISTSRKWIDGPL
jgi:hypothetical protein